MVTAATALTQDTDGDSAIDVYGLGTDVEIIRVAPFVWSNGGDIVDDPDRPTRFTIGSLDAIRPIQAFLDLRGVHGVTPTDEEAESADFETRFLDGSLAMMMESRKVVPSFRTITDFEWDVARLPVHEQPATVLHSDAYCMTAAGERKDQAWEFLEFALGPQGQEIATTTGRTVPSLRSVAESDAFLDPSVPPASSRVFLDNIPSIQAASAESSSSCLDSASACSSTAASRAESSASSPAGSLPSPAAACRRPPAGAAAAPPAPAAGSSSCTARRRPRPSPAAPTGRTAWRCSRPRPPRTPGRCGAGRG